GRRVDLDLEPARPLGPVIDGRLPDDAAHVLLTAHTVPGGVVEPLEAEPPSLVGRRDPRWTAAAEGLREAHVQSGGQVADRVHAHGSGEVEVQMGLGQGPQVPASRGQSASSSPLSPSTRWTAASSAEAAPPSMPTSVPQTSSSTSSPAPSS